MLHKKIIILGSRLSRSSGEKYNSGCLQPSVAHAGDSFIVQVGVRDLVQTDGNMSTEKYHNVISSGKCLVCNICFSMAVIPNTLKMQ